MAEHIILAQLPFGVFPLQLPLLQVKVLFAIVPEYPYVASQDKVKLVPISYIPLFAVLSYVMVVFAISVV